MYHVGASSHKNLCDNSFKMYLLRVQCCAGLTRQIKNQLYNVRNDGNNGPAFKMWF